MEADWSNCCQILVAGRRFTLDMTQVASMVRKLAEAGMPDESFLRGILGSVGPGQVLDVTSRVHGFHGAGETVTADAFAEVLRYAAEPGSYLLPVRTDVDEAFRAEVKAAFDFFGAPATRGEPLVSCAQVRWTMNRLATALAIWRSGPPGEWTGPTSGPEAFAAFLASDKYRQLLRVTMMMNVEPCFELLDRAVRDNQEGWHQIQLNTLRWQ